MAEYEVRISDCSSDVCSSDLSGLGMLDLALAIEALSEGGGGSTLGQLFMVNPIFGGVSIAKFGSERQRQEWLPKIVSGELHCCMALTEPDAGSGRKRVV